MSDQRLAELISRIAHELRSPLTSIKGFSATLANKWDRFNDEQRRQFVETINVDADRMSRIISEVLDLARAESGRLELSRAEVGVASVARRAVDDLADVGETDRVEVAVDAEVSVWVDPERMQHVLRNLIENAIKFSDRGPVTVDAREGGDVVEIDVRDEGFGIEPERLPEIFSGPAPRGSAASPSGTGLGLYLTRRLVEAHGGRITVESVPGQGSTFTVSVPAAKAASR
jgi:signal transduction histidine kinase